LDGRPSQRRRDELIASEPIDDERASRHRRHMSKLKLTVLSLRYSSWSMRPWLAL
jgi:hypothetical protein